MFLFENIGVDGARLWRTGCLPILTPHRKIRKGIGKVGGRCGWAGSFFVGVCNDIDPPGLLIATLATSTGGQRLRIVYHVAELYGEEERAG